MASLRRIIDKQPNVAIQSVPPAAVAQTVPQQPELKRETTSFYNEIPIDIDMSDAECDEFDEPEQKEKYKCVCFLSDTTLTSKIKEQIGQYKNIKKFTTSSFANRNLDDLYEQHGVEYVWINLKQKDARNWIAVQLPKKSKHFTVISVYNISKRAKWLKDVSDYVDHTCKLTELRQQLVALSFKELSQNLDKLELHQVPNRLFACLGISQKVSAKKKP